MSIENKIVPLSDRILVQPIVDEVSKASGIIIPETSEKERPIKGKVIAAGEGRMTDTGEILPMPVKVGDVVIFSKYGPDSTKIEGEEYFIMNASSVLAIIKQ